MVMAPPGTLDSTTILPFGASSDDAESSTGLMFGSLAAAFTGLGGGPAAAVAVATSPADGVAFWSPAWGESGGTGPMFAGRFAGDLFAFRGAGMSRALEPEGSTVVCGCEAAGELPFL